MWLADCHCDCSTSPCILSGRATRPLEARAVVVLVQLLPGASFERHQDVFQITDPVEFTFFDSL